MFDFSVSKDMKKKGIIGGGGREDSNPIMSNIICQGIEK
jgi:hypothetical protein